MDGTQVGGQPPPAMNGTFDTFVFGSPIPERSSPLQMFALFILFIFPGAALVIVSLRAAGRWAWRQFGWDDTLICLAMFMSAIETAASYKFIKTNYVGIRARDLPAPGSYDPTEAMIWNYAVQILYNPILALVKISVLLFLYRLFGQKRGVKWYVMGLTGVTVAHGIATLLAIILQCIPISTNWTPGLPGSKCVDQRSLYASTAAFTILTDVLVLLLPAYIFRTLNIPKKTKIALSVVFLLGGLVTAASIARLITLVVGIYQLIPDPEPTYNIGFVTSAIETNLALITASAPAMMPLLKAWFPSWFGPNNPTGNVKSTPRTPGTPRRTASDKDIEQGNYPPNPRVPRRYD